MSKNIHIPKSSNKMHGIDTNEMNIQNHDRGNIILNEKSRDAAAPGWRINEGFTPELEESTSRCVEQAQCSSTFAAEQPLDQSADAPVIDTSLKLFEEKKETTQMSCSNPVFRNKMLKTILLLWGSTCMGWIFGQMGPIFPDLQYLVGVSLKQGSWLFSGFAIGYLAGCLLGGIALSKFNANLVLFLSSLLVSISIALLPWIPMFPVMVFLRVLTGVGVGGQDTGIISMVFLMWGDKAGPYNQMIHVMFALGGIAAPLVTKPFLKKVSEEEETEIFNTTQHELNASVNYPVDNTTNTELVAMYSTKVHYALLLTGLLYLSGALPFFFDFVKENQEKASPEKRVERVDKHVEKKLPKRVERTVLFLLLVIAFISTACFDLFPSFLTTFLIEQFNWSQQDGSTLTSLFFAMYGVGNFINIFGSIYINSTKIMLFSYVSGIVTFAGILLSIVFSHTTLIWATISIAGLAGSNIIPLLYTWTHEYVTPVTNAITSALLISGSLGISLNPLLVGYMMDEYSPMWFIYLSFGYIVCCAILFLTAVIFVKLYTIKTKTDVNEIEINVPESDISPNGYLHESDQITRF